MQKPRPFRPASQPEPQSCPQRAAPFSPLRGQMLGTRNSDDLTKVKATAAGTGLQPADPGVRRFLAIPCAPSAFGGVASASRPTRPAVPRGSLAPGAQRRSKRARGSSPHRHGSAADSRTRLRGGENGRRHGRGPKAAGRRPRAGPTSAPTSFPVTRAMDAAPAGRRRASGVRARGSGDGGRRSPNLGALPVVLERSGSVSCVILESQPYLLRWIP